ncbi:MAG: nitroreductase [Firmicutes bacterium]|nr:nitroreductase [Bacillota bacterium]
MQTIDAIRNRRSIRHFTDKEVTDENIARILKAGILAPSAKNKQPWFIHVIQDDTLKQELVDIMKDTEDVGVQNTARVMEEAPVIFVIFEEKTDLNTRMTEQSIGAFMENMCLEATSLEIGSLWIGHVLEKEKEIKKLFGEKRKLACAIALGYAKKEPKPRPRRNLKDMICIHDKTDEK